MYNIQWPALHGVHINFIRIHIARKNSSIEINL